MVGFRLNKASETNERDMSMNHSVNEWSSHQIPEELAHSDDDRSIAADSWSVKSEYGSTLDGDDSRHAEVMEVMATVTDQSQDETHMDSDEEGDDADVSVLGLRSHWDTTYEEELNNFLEHGHCGEVWFGENVLETSSEWIANLANLSTIGEPAQSSIHESQNPAAPAVLCKVLDLGTGNGLLLHALARRGFTDLTGTDYCEPAVALARAVAQREGFSNISFLVDDVLDSKLEGQFNLVVDKGTLDAVKLHPEGRNHKKLYRRTVEKLTAPGGLLVITSCNTTKDELVSDITSALESVEVNGKGPSPSSHHVTPISESCFEYVDHIRSYPTFRFGGVEGSRVCTVAFRRKTSA